MAAVGPKKQWFNSNIFYINGRPMRFYLEGYELCQFHEISRIVEAYGGKLSTPDADTIVFSEPGRYADTDRRRFHIKCLRDSILHNQLQDINKYALPWRIIERQKTINELKIPKTEESKMPTKNNNESPQKQNTLSKKITSSSQPYIALQDCLKIQHNKRSPATTSNTRLSLEQSVSTLANVKPKSADEEAQVALKQRASLPDKQHKATKRKQTPKKSQTIDNQLEIIDIVPRKMLVKDIIDISDSEDAVSVSEEPAEMHRRSESQLDWKNLTNFVDVPNALAVWSSAGPPGPPTSDDEQETTNRPIKIEENSPMTRERARRMNYAGLDVSDSEEGSGKGKRRGRRKKICGSATKSSEKKSTI